MTDKQDISRQTWEMKYGYTDRESGLPKPRSKTRSYGSPTRLRQLSAGLAQSVRKSARLRQCPSPAPRRM